MLFSELKNDDNNTNTIGVGKNEQGNRLNSDVYKNKTKPHSDLQIPTLGLRSEFGWILLYI